MLGFVRDFAGRWAEQRFVRANRVLRYRLKLAEEAKQHLTESVERLRVRRGIDRDVRVRAETEVAELTKANLKLSGLLSDARLAAPVSADPVAVGKALEAREAAAVVYATALADFLDADAAYRNAFNAVYLSEGGPEHLRKVAAEDRATDERAARDKAEVARVAAEQSVRLAELGFRAALAGAVADEAGDQ